MKSFLFMLGAYIAIGALFMGGVFALIPPVQAAPVADGVEMCEKIATTGPLDIYRCPTDNGNLFVNSVGFMVLEE